MAKMFYSIEEAAQRLGKSIDEVQGMASTGQLQEFRDRDKLMFKREQVDLLAGDDAPAGRSGTGISLADSSVGMGGAGGSSITLALDDDEPAGMGGGKGGSKMGSGPKPTKSGSSMGIEIDEPMGRSGISIFDADSTDDTDPLAATAVTPAMRRGMPSGGGEMGDLTAVESGGSGSGLLDLTRESDDTSLGADLLEDVYKGDEDGRGSETQGSSGLFESTSAPSDMSAAAAMPAMAMMASEPYDGTWSGIGGGLALGSALVVLVGLFTLLMGLLEAGDNPLISTLSQNLVPVAGGFALLVILSAGIGWFLGRKS